jgi:DNA polymerase III epsilon subunit-like protein
MVNFNGHMLCSLDTETTGRTPGYHEVASIGVQPLDSDFEFILDPFYIEIKPDYPERAEKGAMAKNGFTLDYLMETGVDSQTAVDLFVDWKNKLGLSGGKRIIPLAHNFPFDKAMLLALFGQDLYDDCFAWSYRDSMALASSMNDLCNAAGNKTPFPSISLVAICKAYGLQYDNAHNSLADARACAQVYKYHIKSFLGGRV